MELFLNPKEVYDGAIPGGNSVMAYNFVRLYQLMENEKYRELAKKTDVFFIISSERLSGRTLYISVDKAEIQGVFGLS